MAEIYIGDSFEANTLDELKAAVVAAAEAAWGREIKYQVLDTYERLARGAGLLPPRIYDPLADAKTQKLWQQQLIEECTRRVMFFGAKRDA